MLVLFGERKCLSLEEKVDWHYCIENNVTKMIQWKKLWLNMQMWKKYFHYLKLKDLKTSLLVEIFWKKKKANVFAEKLLYKVFHISDGKVENGKEKKKLCVTCKIKIY